MKNLTNIINAIFLVFLTLSFSQCVNTKNAMKVSETIHLSNEPTTQLYYQNWIAGVKGGGSGTNLFIAQSLLAGKKPIKAYFKGKSATFEFIEINKEPFYAAYFRGDSNQLKDYVMDADAVQEYENKIPVKKETFPFGLLENEAVISYKENNTIMYLKLTNISEKEMLAYPSAPRN